MDKEKRKSLILVLSIVALVGVLIGASFLYRKLSEKPELASLELIDKSERPVAPDFTVYDKDGNEVRLSDYKGTPVVLNFWASWCPPCKEEMPYFQTQYENHKDDDIVFLMVNTIGFNGETVESASSYVEKEGYTFPIVYDLYLETSIAYGVSGVPLTYFINGEGKLIAGVGGSIPETMLEDGIVALLNDM